MPKPSAFEPSRPRDGWVSLGMLVSATSAALSSFSGLYELAVAAGWASLMAPLLPLTVDAFAATATRVWLAASTSSQRARRFARSCAVGAILLSLAGNAVWHLIAAQLLAVDWVIVFAVGAIPPVVLGLVSHLAVLRTQRDSAVEDEVRTVLSPVPTTVQTEAAQEKAAVSRSPRPAQKQKAALPRYAGTEELLAAARVADAAYREAQGKSITRDELRQTLRIGGERATALLRQIKEERAESV